MPKLKYGRFRITRDGLHQVRYRRDGYDMQFTAKDLKTVKEKFREWVKSIPKTSERKKTRNPARTFGDFAIEYFENVKRQNVSKETYDGLLITLNKHVLPALGALPAKDITPLRCQALLNELLNAGKGRTAEKVKVLLKELLRGAIGERLAVTNPMDYVKIPRHVKKNGTALSLEEIRSFVAECETSYYRKQFLLLLYTGIRRGELKSAKFDGNFITVANGKCRKGEPQTYRKIPICKELRDVLPMTEKELNVCPKVLSNVFKRMFPEHHLYKLRHTFTTRCMECGVSKAVVDVWTGHVNRSDMTTAVYTHFSDEFMLKEMEKLHF